MSEPESGVDLYWLPLGAGGSSVRVNGKVFEAVAALAQHRDRRDLYHAALEVRVPEGRFVIEQAPAGRGDGGERGVVAEGAVGSRCAGRLRIFRYEVRCWRGGSIPDIDEAVESPRRLTDDGRVARRLLDLVPRVPTAVWGRDELAAGEMWSSNAIIAWLLARSGLDAESIALPAGGRAPGWDAGLVVARRRPPFLDADVQVTPDLLEQEARLSARLAGDSQPERRRSFATASAPQRLFRRPRVFCCVGSRAGMRSRRRGAPPPCRRRRRRSRRPSRSRSPSTR